MKYDVHKVILVSCSDYFRSMFTSGMKECNQKEIELKGVTSKGLEKVSGYKLLDKILFVA
jgi:kelch-like protein 9/13